MICHEPILDQDYATKGFYYMVYAIKNMFNEVYFHYNLGAMNHYQITTVVEKSLKLFFDSSEIGFQLDHNEHKRSNPSAQKV